MDYPKVLDVRRLPGPSVVMMAPGAILDLACAPSALLDASLLALQRHVTGMQMALGWPKDRLVQHSFEGGLGVALAAPLDGLYTAVDLLQWAWRATAVELGFPADPDGVLELDLPMASRAAAQALRGAAAAEANPALLTLVQAAAEHGVSCLVDDELLSLGHGQGSRSWPVQMLPTPDAVPWAELHNLPLALVTGTNGKTTSVRMLARMARAAGKTVGLSSTDGVWVTDSLVDGGDYSGPGGARLVLRQPQVQLALLETARGGLLRRGLGVTRATAALITNIAEDHLGDFGSRSMQELLAVKWVVTRALAVGSSAVLNADDPLLVAKATELAPAVAVIWFSPDPDNPVLLAHCAEGGTALTVVGGQFVRCQGLAQTPLCPVAAVPVTINGHARHNVANALGAMAVAGCLGLPDAALVQGLTGMQVNDNPGRCNMFRLGQVDVLVDFAHNPEGVAAILDLAAAHPAKRRLVAVSQPGDRTDRNIREVGAAVWALAPDRVLVSELAAHYRGRQPGVVVQLLVDGMVAAGASPGQIGHCELEMDALAAALAWAEPGDLLVLLVLDQRTEVLARLQELAVG